MLNGTKCLLMFGINGNYSTIAGQVELSANIAGTPIDTSSKSSDDWRTFINSEIVTNGLDVSGSIIYSSASGYRSLKSAQDTHQIQEFKLSFNENDEVDLYFSGLVSGVSDAIPQGDRVTTSFTITTTDEIYKLESFIPSGDDGLTTSDGDIFMVRQ